MHPGKEAEGRRGAGTRVSEGLLSLAGLSMRRGRCVGTASGWGLRVGGAVCGAKPGRCECSGRGAHNGLEVEPDEGRDDAELEGDGEERSVQPRVTNGEPLGREAHLRYRGGGEGRWGAGPSDRAAQAGAERGGRAGLVPRRGRCAAATPPPWPHARRMLGRGDETARPPDRQGRVTV